MAALRALAAEPLTFLKLLTLRPILAGTAKKPEPPKPISWSI
jgi:hypothetical protein